MKAPHPNSPPPEPKALMTRDRRGKIADLVRASGAVRVTELAARFGVSEVTIRTDLAKLEDDGRLVRDHGGAISRDATQQVTSLAALDQRASENVEAKRRVARAAAAMISPGDTIILDAGTTVVELARLLRGIKQLTVVTNAFNVAAELAESEETRLIFLGGTLNRDSFSTVGALGEHNLAELVVQKLFLGTQAFDLEHGLTDSTPEIAETKRAMIRAAREVILLTDSSKWGRAGFVKVAPIADLDTIIVDDAFPEDSAESFARLGVKLVRA